MSVEGWMPYAGEYEARTELKRWMQENGITYAILAERCNVSRQAIGQYCNGYLHSLVVRNELRQMGCPEKFLKKRPKHKAQPHTIQLIRQSTGYYNPWAEGEIMCPPGVSSNSILMCPLR
jgi:transcriptional regulator with XRE-family HTH domain